MGRRVGQGGVGDIPPLCLCQHRMVSRRVGQGGVGDIPPLSVCANTGWQLAGGWGGRGKYNANTTLISLSTQFHNWMTVKLIVSTVTIDPNFESTEAPLPATLAVRWGSQCH